MIAPRPIEGAFFGGAGDAARGNLRDVDVGEVVGGGGVFGDGQGDGGGGDEFAEEPADVLLEGGARGFSVRWVGRERKSMTVGFTEAMGRSHWEVPSVRSCLYRRTMFCSGAILSVGWDRRSGFQDYGNIP